MCECKNALVEKSENFYLTITIFNTNNKEIEIFDEGSLTAITLLVEVDNKQRVRFFSWSDDEFIDDLKWIVKHLNTFLTNSIKNKKLLYYNDNIS